MHHMLFPGEAVVGPVVRVEIEPDSEGFPVVVWTGLLDPGGGAHTGPVPLVENGPGMPLLGEHARGLFTRPHLRGHRVAVVDDRPGVGLSWSPKLVCEAIDESTVDGRPRLRVRTADAQAGLALTTELESVAGGALRMRHTLLNKGPGSYLLEGLDVVLPADDRFTESLDFAGRHERERSPQRRRLTDGLWLRESRHGRPGLGAPTMLVLGTEGFSTTSGEVLAAHVAWSGNSSLQVERDAGTGTTLGGGELLLPGEVALAEGESYTTPWVLFAAADDGLDGLAAMWHAYQRALSAHPVEQPVILNVWEAVYFDHAVDHLRGIADRAARVGVELFVLDDGWFRYRRDDRAGLGDWYVDEQVWPDGLTPLADHVRSLGMGFGLWFEPEMVNPDSDLYRAHPDWILSAGDRLPLLHRNQLVLDLSRPEVWEYLLERIDAVLTDYPIDFVKWDHNRDLLEAGSSARLGAPVVHAQTRAFYALLDALRDRHPGVAWESCASGGGRVDLGVLERVQRVWTSDMTDALARQQIQRWSTQLLAPEYVGAHVSSPTSHTTGRTLSLDFRAATALFGSFGIEWDLSTADEHELEQLAGWVERYKAFRGLLHSGRVVRPESSDPTVLLHGVVSSAGDEALLAHVQLDESVHNRGVRFRVPGLQPDATYDLRWEGPVQHREVSKSSALPVAGPTDGRPVTGRALATQGFWVPRRRPETVTLVRLTQRS
jgi:alpha-galactosidase